MTETDFPHQQYYPTANLIETVIDLKIVLFLKHIYFKLTLTITKQVSLIRDMFFL